MLLSRKCPHLFIEHEQVSTYKYLGQIIIPSHGMNTLSNYVWEKKVVGLPLQHSLQKCSAVLLCNLLTSLVRPILEYACQVWDPYTLKNKQHFKRNMLYISALEDGLLVMRNCWNPNIGQPPKVCILHQFHTHHFYIPPDITTICFNPFKCTKFK